MDRLLTIPLALLLLVRLLPLLRPLLSVQQHRALQNMVSGIDVAGGAIMLVLIGYQLYRREWLGAVLIGVLAVPVLIGSYRALPGWWWGAGAEPPSSSGRGDRRP